VITYFILMRAFRSLLLPLKAILLNLLSIGAAYGLLVLFFKYGPADWVGLVGVAVAEGLAKTGRIVTAAGLIMVAAFLGFVAGSIVGLQQFGFGLATAILLDVTIVRTILVPSAMELMGRWNWWLPDGIARVFRVEPSPLAPPRRSAAVTPAGR
jgi:RND superfamily putative drug exporter